VRGVQLANHQPGDTPHLVGRARAGDVGLDLRPCRLPVDAVELRVEEVVAQQEALELLSGPSLIALGERAHHGKHLA
jgi:hypothetical protein